MIGEQGPVATIALILLVPLTFFLFSTRRPARAAALVTFGALFFAPELAYFKFPSVPPLTKENIPYLCMVIAALIQFPTAITRNKPARGPEALILLALVATFMTVVTNGDVLVYGTWQTTVLPSMTVNDGLAMGLADVLIMMVPFFLGRALFKTSRDLLDLVKVLVGFGLIYIIPIAIELRLSPQMNPWVYGYTAHEDFLQVLRWGGYRPVVFLRHGLALGLLMLHCTLLATALAKVRVPVTSYVKPRVVAAVLVVVLVLCKSTGAIAYGAVVLPLVWLSRTRTQVRFAAVIAVVVLVYPFLREAELVPVRPLISVARAFSEARAESLEFRFDNEEVLLEKARERFLFGWGSYGRNSIYDSDMGRLISVTDGHWIIVLGTRGMVGLVCAFLLLVYPVLVTLRRLRLVPDKRDQILLAALALVLAIGTGDLIPNGLFNNYPFFIAGALLGVVRNLTSPKMLQAAHAGMLEDPYARASRSGSRGAGAGQHVRGTT